MENNNISWIRVALTSTLMSVLGCGNKIEYTGFEQHPVDQVFRDFYGYRTYFTDESAVQHEQEYRSYTCPENQFFPQDTPPRVKSQFRYLNPEAIGEDDAIKVIYDLNNDKRGYALVLNYRCEGLNNPRYNINNLLSFVEVHLPKDAKLNPGYSSTGGKNPSFSPMNEIE